jgi:uncharacterized protein (TIGR02452 family)
MSLKQNAKDVLTLLERGSYVVDGATVSIAEAQARSVAGTVLYTPEGVEGLPPPGGSLPSVEIVDATTQVAARDLSREGAVTLLTFASARNPGGGFLNGAKAQEEDLCRCSGLYPTLLTKRAYYDANRNQSSLLYTDHAILSPEVPFFKVRGTGDLLAEPFVASVITAPAPNTGPYLRRQGASLEALQAAFARRWRNVFRIAHDHGATTLLLGAWGCGAFGGDAGMAADTVSRVLAAGTGSVTRVVFAIPGRGKRSRKNLERFRAVLA